MAEQYFVRIRGRVSGPFEVAQLKSMVQRGRFSRAHEVSVDGTTWLPASDVGDLFPQQKRSEQSTNKEPTVEKPTSPTGEPQNDITLAPPASESGAEQWYYSDGSTKMGPVRLNELQALAAQGVLQEDSVVWRQGMASWKAAAEIPQLSSLFGPSRPVIKTKSTRTEEANREVKLVATRPLGWVLFLVLFALVCGGLLIVLGIWLTASGFEEGSSSNILNKLSAQAKISVGLTSAVVGGTFLLGAYLLNGFRVSLIKFVDTGKALPAVFVKLHGFIVYISILFIIYLAFILVVIIQAISVGGAS